MASERQPASAPDTPEQLRALGKFQIHKRLGAGGMGAVFLATDTDLKRTVALKVLPKDRAENPTLVRRFKAEAQAVAQLHHDNIVSIYEAGEIQGFPYLALEYVDGQDALTLIEKRGILPAKRSLKMIRQVADALQHAFERNIVHRDIKPSNLLVQTDGTVKITDLGLARSVDETLDTSITRAGTTVGTIDYISPEQACDSKAADIRSDLYSLGCTWYHMLTGQPPFPDGDLKNKLQAHMASPPPNPRDLNPNVPESYVAVMHRLMAKRPEDRYQTPASLIADLDQVDQAASQLNAALFGDDSTPPTARRALTDSKEPTRTDGQRSDGQKRSPTTGAAREAAPAPPRDTPAGARSAAPTDTRSTPASPAAPDVPQKMKLRGASKPQEPTTPGAARRREQSAPDASAPADTESPSTAESVKSRKLPQRDQRRPTGFAIDIDLARIALVGGIVAGAIGLFWWAFSRGDKDLSGGGPVITPVVPETPAEPEQPAPPGAGPRAPTENTADATGRPPGAAAGTGMQFVLAGDIQNAQRDRPAFVGVDDLLDPNALAAREFVPDWVYALRAPPAAGASQMTIDLPTRPGAPATLQDAVASLRGPERVIELHGQGVLPVGPQRIQGVNRLIIRAAPNSNPVLLFDGASPAGANLDGLLLQGGILELDGVHLLAVGEPGTDARTLLGVAGGTLILRHCTVTAPRSAGPTVVCRAISSSAHRDYPTRVLLETCLFRGDQLTAIDAQGERVDVIVADSCLASRAGALLNVTLAPPEGAAAPSAAGDAGTPAVNAPAGTERPSFVRFIGSTLVTGGQNLRISQPPGTSILRGTIQVRRSLCAALDAQSVLLQLPQWPARTTNVSGQPRLAGLNWRQEQSRLAGWPTLVQLVTTSGPVIARDAAEWRDFWSSPLESDALPEAAVTAKFDDYARLTADAITQSLANVSSPLAGGPRLGVDGHLPQPPQAMLDRQELLSARPRLPAGYRDLPQPATVVRRELKAVQRNLNDFLNGPDVPNGARVQLTGVGLITLPPLHLLGKSLQLEFLQASEGAPLVLRPEEAKGKSREASIIVENGRLDLINARIQASPSKSREFPPRLLQIRDGELTLRNCQLEGALSGTVAEEPLIEWVRSGPRPGREHLFIDNSLITGAQPLLSADVDQRLLTLHNSILAGRETALTLRTSIGKAAVTPADAGWIVLDQCTILSADEGVRVSGATAGRTQPAGYLVSKACLFSVAPGEPADRAAILAHPTSMTARNLFDWWESHNAYGSALRRYRQSGDEAGNSPQDFQTEWVQFWGADHVESPVTGPSGVVFATVLTSLQGATALNFGLTRNCTAVHAAPDGGPIGARVDRIGPIGVAASGSGGPIAPTAPGSAPTAPITQPDF